MSCQLIHYVHDEHDKFFEVAKKFDFIIVRCNPGQIKADGGSQQKFDDGMREVRKAGIQVWPSPDVMEKMGAKDALCKVAKLNIGLEDTLSRQQITRDNQQTTTNKQQPTNNNQQPRNNIKETISKKQPNGEWIFEQYVYTTM